MFDKQVYEKMTSYCSYTERSKSDVITKLYKLKVEKEDQAAYIIRLGAENFLNEERYARSFVSAHSKKKWGKMKIKSALMQKQLPAALIKKYLDDIDEATYGEQIKILALKKIKTIKTGTSREKHTKLMRYLISKGFEMQQITLVLKALNLS